MLQKGCDLGKPYACSYLSGLYITGKHFGLEKDMQKARELCEKGCDLEEAPCCANLSQVSNDFDNLFIQPNFSSLLSLALQEICFFCV